MSVTREQFVAEARSWIGTPYQHQGRLKGIACDCIGLVICTAQALGLTRENPIDYGKRPDGRLRFSLEQHVEPIPTSEAQAADILLFQWNAVPLHVAIMTDGEHMIHAYLPNRKVVESRIDERIRRQLEAAYHVPGVV
jgi:NlpC/P60 family putative phage cell wall peptidase